MFDWQAELAPITSAAITTACHLSVAAIDSATPHASATFSPPMQAAIPKPTFAQALRSPQVQSEPLPVPSIRGETLPIKITNVAYYRGLEACKINLRGRLVLNKGDKPYATTDIYAKLQKLWKVKESWHMKVRKTQEGGLNCVF
jgi:hypothetical protein